MSAKVLLFDIGGVLIDFVGPEGLSEMLGGRYSIEETWRMWPQSRALRQHELGQTSVSQFAREFIAEWGLELSPERFLNEANAWVRGPYPGALQLLDELQGVATLACLSNINATFWERIRDDMGLGSRLQHCYTSFEIGLLKPQPAAFQHVISDLACEPGEILFFDDTLANVNAAGALGLRACQTQGIDELRAALAREFDAGQAAR